MKLGMVRSNPTDLCDLPKVRRKKIHPMEQKEIAAFLKAIEGCKCDLVCRVTLFTGMRQGEILGLTWHCVDFEHNALNVNKQLQKTKRVGGEYVLAPTKSGRSRMMTVAPSVMHLLKKTEAPAGTNAAAGGTGLEESLGSGIYK